MKILLAISEGWSWIGVKPVEICELNQFGNVIFKDSSEGYWRICPEELSCTRIAVSEADFYSIRQSPDFKRDWEMSDLVEAALRQFGAPGEGRCFCLKVPGVLGGKYELSNIGTISIEEAVRFSGDIAEQIEDVPDGARIKFTFVD